MSTKVYGASDDLIEFEGEIYGEVNCYGTDDQDKGVLLIFSDGTMLEVKYGKMDQAIWGIQVLKQGPLFHKLEICDSEDAEIYSDVAHFMDGIKWCYSATEWEKVK